MHVTAHLDIDLVALEVEDHVTCMLQLAAPESANAAARPGHTLIVALDRSGSMRGAPLEGAKQALRSLTRRLAQQDRFGVVAFDDSAVMAVPVQAMSAHDPLLLDQAIAAIQTGGGTDLSAGYRLALRRARQAARDAASSAGIHPASGPGATILLLSDGHANAGETDPVVLGAEAGFAAYAGNITTSTVGLGLGYDEVLLSILAREGSGAHRFAEDVDAATAAVAAEVDGLLAKTVIGTELRIHPQDGLVDAVLIPQGLPTWVEGGATVVVALGDLYAGEQRQVIVGLRVPALPALGLATVADLALEYTSLPDLAEHEITLPVAVNVVPADVAAGRVPDPVVVVATTLAESGMAAATAAQALRDGDPTTAVTTLEQAIDALAATTSTLASTGITASVGEEAEQALRDLRDLANRARSTATDPTTNAWTAKSLTDSSSSLGRGRTSPGRRPSSDPAPDPDGSP